MKFIITGGCGFVGGNLAEYFARQGHEVVAVDNMSRKGSELNAERLSLGGVRVVRDTASKFAEERTKEFDGAVVLHCAAQPSAVDGYNNPRHDFTSNIIETEAILEACRKTGAGLIYWSTNKVFSAEVINDQTHHGMPPIDGANHSIYGVTKLCGDLLCQEYATAFGLSVVVNRFSCLAGPWQFGKTEQGWVAWFVIAAEFGLPIKLIGWEGKQVRDVLFAQDICNLVGRQAVNLAKHPGVARVFQVGGGKKNAISLWDYLHILSTKFGYELRIQYEPSARRADHRVYVSNIEDVCQHYHWRPGVSVENGTEQIVEWVKNHKDQLRELVA